MTIRLTAYKPFPVQSGASKQAAEDWHHEGTFENPMNPRERVVKDGEAIGKYAIVPHTSDTNHFYLANVHALTRGGGKAALQHLTRQADKHGVTLSLYPVPLAPAGEGVKMTPANLGSWYHQLGFRPAQGDRMVRTPARVQKSMQSQSRLHELRERLEKVSYRL